MSEGPHETVSSEFTPDPDLTVRGQLARRSCAQTDTNCVQGLEDLRQRRGGRAAAIDVPRICSSDRRKSGWPRRRRRVNRLPCANSNGLGSARVLTDQSAAGVQRAMVGRRAIRESMSLSLWDSIESRIGCSRMLATTLNPLAPYVDRIKYARPKRHRRYVQNLAASCGFLTACELNSQRAVG